MQSTQRMEMTMKRRITVRNRKVGAMVREQIEYQHRTGKDDRSFKIAQEIGHRKPYSFEHIEPRGKLNGRGSGNRNPADGDPDNDLDRDNEDGLK